ncbi:hypothetical protein R69746_06187 [Paraburkholderia aspalathi]|nr:hypothetical protein R69746_06187 [Paraburkholderia aspalathi]
MASPLRQPAAIARWFKQQGFEVKTKPNGMPLVSRSNFEYVMRGVTATPGTGDIDHGRNRPDVDALMRRIGKQKEH